ncbi:MAG: LamG-like jellyroll fold domain-containing protein [Candidatus Paceibacterota bacterium]|jgi:prepilin-type N-terminal cleavage/methylation domain-containing protein
MQPENSRQSKMQKAFTLIELLVVVAIIGILAGMAVVNMSGAADRARIAKGITFASSIQRSMALNMPANWNFDGQNANDSSGNNNNGTVVGALAYSTEAPFGSGIAGNYSADFNGSSYVSVNNTLANGYSALTVEAWFKSRPSAAYRTLISKGYHTSSVFEMRATRDSEGPNMGFRINDAAGHTAVVSTVFTNNVWHHVALVYDGALLKAYLDGKSIGSAATASGLLISNANNVEIGRNGSGEFMNGLVDEVKIYSQAFTASSVRNDYLAGLEKFWGEGRINKEEYQKRSMELNSNYAIGK